MSGLFKNHIVGFSTRRLNYKSGTATDMLSFMTGLLILQSSMIRELLLLLVVSGCVRGQSINNNGTPIDVGGIESIWTATDTVSILLSCLIYGLVNSYGHVGTVPPFNRMNLLSRKYSH